MISYDITMALQGAASDDDFGSSLLCALSHEGIEGVVAHDLSEATLEIDMTVTAQDLIDATNKAVAAVSRACSDAGGPVADLASLSVSRAREPEHTAA